MNNEQRIIREIRAGNTERYAYLVDCYHVGLIIHCERLVGDRMEAEDIAQKSFIKAYQKLAVFDSEKGRFSTWLYKIATNEALDYLRKTKRVVVTEDIEDAVPTMPDQES